MSKGFLYKQVGGRREGETPVYKFDWWKVLGGFLLTALLGWGTWVTINCFKAEEADKKIDMQTQVLHGRVTKVDDRVTALVWRFFEQELDDCQEGRDECQE